MAEIFFISLTIMGIVLIIVGNVFSNNEGYHVNGPPTTPKPNIKPHKREESPKPITITFWFGASN